MGVNRVVRGRSVFPGALPVLRTELRKQGFSADRISRLYDPVTRFAIVPRGAQRLGSKCNSVTRLGDGVTPTDSANPTRAFYFGHYDYLRRRQSDAAHDAYWQPDASSYQPYTYAQPYGYPCQPQPYSAMWEPDIPVQISAANPVPTSNNPLAADIYPPPRRAPRSSRRFAAQRAELLELCIPAGANVVNLPENSRVLTPYRHSVPSAEEVYGGVRDAFDLRLCIGMMR